MTKSAKSQQRERSPLFANSSRVHELVARAMRGKCVRHRLMVQAVSFALPATSSIPRVRTHHTKKPSRFVHALSARPLKVHWRACGSSCADGMELYFSFWLLALLGFYFVGVGAVDDPHGRGINTHASHCLIPTTTRKKHALRRAVSYELFHIIYRLGECALVAMADLFFRYRLDSVAGVGGAE